MRQCEPRVDARVFFSVRRALLAVALAAPLAFTPRAASAQWVTSYEQFYREGRYNWEFLRNYPAAAKLFNGFDFGHAILYETLLTKPGQIDVLEQKWFNRLTRDILVDVPAVPLEEAAIEPTYVRLAPEAKLMFEWAHLFHRQIYDVWSDDRLSEAEKDAEVQRLIAYYKSRPDLAFSSRPKSMKLMQEQPYSLAFRKGYPKFNGLIWAYHWLQVGLYEPFMVTSDPDRRQQLVNGMVARFWQMIQGAPESMPHQMPMTAAVAPEFAKRYQEAAIIFDNLHSMHDVVSDILANESVPRRRKRDEIMLAARRFRDDTSYVMTVEGWRTMAQQMGVENMGGMAVGYLDSLPEPTVTYGAVMTHDDRTGEMIGMKDGEMLGGHNMSGMSNMNRGGSDSSRMGHTGPAADSGATALSPSVMDMHMRMMADPVIRRRMVADTALRRMMTEMMGEMPAEHRVMMERMMKDTAGAPRPRRGTASPAPRREPARPAADPHAGHTKPAPKPAPKPAAKPPADAPSKPADPHAGHTSKPSGKP